MVTVTVTLVWGKKEAFKVAKLARTDKRKEAPPFGYIFLWKIIPPKSAQDDTSSKTHNLYILKIKVGGFT